MEEAGNDLELVPMKKETMLRDIGLVLFSQALLNVLQLSLSASMTMFLAQV